MVQFGRSILILGLCAPLLVTLVLSGRSLYDAAQAGSPAPPAPVAQEAELKSALDMARPYLDDEIRPEVLAQAVGVRADHVDEDPNRAADKLLLAAVGEHADLLARTADLFRRVSDPNGPAAGPLAPPPASTSYAKLLDERRAILKTEALLRENPKNDPAAVEEADLDQYFNSPASDLRIKRPSPPLSADNLILVPLTRTAVKDAEFCEKIAQLQKSEAPRLLGGAVHLIDADGKAHNWPATGPPTSGIIEDQDPATIYPSLRNALSEDKRVQGQRPTRPHRTLILWRSDSLPEDDNDTSRVIRIAEDRRGGVTLDWVREGKDLSKKLRGWFPDGVSYDSASELDLLFKDVRRFLQQ